MRWYQIHLSPEENISGKQFQVQNAFTPNIMVNNAPKEFALFSAFNAEDGSVDIFVSPQLAAVTTSMLATYAAIECEKPESGSVGLLVGHQNPYELFNLWGKR
ncbi:MAG: hypothetical protein ABIT70_09725 [Sulfuriferula sp.]